MKERAEFTAKCMKVMEAFILGKTIECSNLGREDWSEMPHPSWDWCNFQYRVRPEPMEIEVWVDDRNGLFLSVLGDRDHQSFMERSGYTKKKFREVL